MAREISGPGLHGHDSVGPVHIQITKNRLTQSTRMRVFCLAPARDSCASIVSPPRPSHACSSQAREATRPSCVRAMPVDLGAVESA